MSSDMPASVFANCAFLFVHLVLWIGVIFWISVLHARHLDAVDALKSEPLVSAVELLPNGDMRMNGQTFLGRGDMPVYDAEGILLCTWSAPVHTERKEAVRVIASLGEAGATSLGSYRDSDTKLARIFHTT